jgi:hypothetical protein
MDCFQKSDITQVAFNAREWLSVVEDLTKEVNTRDALRSVFTLLAQLAGALRDQK